MSYTLQLLRVDLTNQSVSSEEINQDTVRQFIGGRGIAAKLLWEELDPGIDPLGPENKLILAAGPLTGLPLPSSGKLVIAGKSPSTCGYGDGNIGSSSAVQLRKAGYDIVVLEGEATTPTRIHLDDQGVAFLDAQEMWGESTFEKERFLTDEYGEGVGRLVTGPGGENRVRFSTVISQNGRAGGRTGMGAVMGSKQLAAISVTGNGSLPIENEDQLRTLAGKAYTAIQEKDEYDFWVRQGTMQAFRWCQVNSTLPTRNFSEGEFEGADGVDGYSMERHKTTREGCPNCNMQCGNVIEDYDGKSAELDYENVAMLGPNLGIDDIRQVGVLNRMCDKFGLDTISAGSSLAFAIECSNRGLIEEELSFGDFDGARNLLEEITYRNGLGDELAEGTKRFSESLGNGAEDWAMHVKGLEISAYDCHTLPGMALAYGTCSIGAHHKDSWLISWELAHERDSYGDGKIEELIEQQRKRGGAFESFTTCRLPWIEVGFSLDWYEDFFEAATGIDMDWDDFDQVGDRIYSLIRSQLVREYGDQWEIEQDFPPNRWFDDPLTKGKFAGSTLDREKYRDMLKRYYSRRGWDELGRPTRDTLDRLGLRQVAAELDDS